MRAMQLFTSDVNNAAFVRNVYGAAGGPTAGTLADPTTPYVGGGFAPAGMTSGGDGVVGGIRSATGDAASVDAATGGTMGTQPRGNPLAWWGVLVVLLVALMWVSQRYGSEGTTFSNVKMTVYNVLVIALASIIGIGFFKMVFGKVQVPGLSTFIAAI